MKSKLLITNSLSLVLATSFFACSFPESSIPNQSFKILEKQTNSYITDVSSLKTGARISVKLNTTTLAKNFAIKVNKNGVPSSASAIDNYLVYLVKHANLVGYPAGGDPLGTDRVAGPFLLKNEGAVNRNFIFNNVLPSNGSAYYIAVRARDINNQDILKNNNGSVTPWTGTTATTTLGVAVSGGAGVTVNANYQVSSTNPLVITANMKDLQGAEIEGNITPSAGVFPTPTMTTNTYIDTIAGNGTAGYNNDNILATNANLNGPTGIYTDNKGNIYISDKLNHRIRKVDPFGNINTIAGTGVAGYSGDNGLAISAQLREPAGIFLDSSNNIYFCDSWVGFIRKINPLGIITTVAGNGAGGFGGDGGPATSAPLGGPMGVVVDSTGNIYISSHFQHRIRKVDTGGTITTVVGNGTNTFAGDGGQATAASLNAPYQIALDSTGNLYIADRDNHRVRKVTIGTGIITTVAGNGTGGFSGDGALATAASLNRPTSVSFDSTGNMYITDSNNNKVRKVDTSGIISTVVGTSLGFSGDNNQASLAQLNSPQGSTIDNNNNLYIADTTNNRVRKVF